MTADSRYITELVRQEDRDRFLTALFAPADRRDDLMALYAFNAELARIRSSVSEMLIGRMKLQWWKDAVENIYAGNGAPKGHPVAEALGRIIIRHNLSGVHFETMFAAREKDFEEIEPSSNPTNAKSLESYAENTASRLTCLVLQLLGVEKETSYQAAQHVGVAYALTGILRAVLMHARENRLYLPQDRMAAAGLTGLQDVHLRRNSQALAAIIKELAATASAHVTRARTIKVEPTAVPALLIATAAEHHLKNLERAAYDVADARVIFSRVGVLSLIWKAWRGKF